GGAARVASVAAPLGLRGRLSRARETADASSIVRGRRAQTIAMLITVSPSARDLAGPPLASDHHVLAAAVPDGFLPDDGARRLRGEGAALLAQGLVHVPLLELVQEGLVRDLEADGRFPAVPPRLAQDAPQQAALR